MARIRILVVDDSVVIRKLLTSALGELPDMEVVTTAAHGKIALAKLEQHSIDVVILDVEMPEMDGIQTLKQIRKGWPRLPVIMFSTRTERGASATIEALTHGASDYVTKPSNVGSVVVAMARIRDEMAPTIRALTGGRGGVRALPRAATPAAPALARPARGRPPVEILAIGASTGGPGALAVLLGALPASFPVPIVIVQHMLATFTRHFAERLAAQCGIEVVEATAGDLLRPGRAHIARGDHHLLVERRPGGVRLAMNQAAPENFCRPAVDVLFRSVADACGDATLAVVLTGMGQDGLVGARAIHEAGGEILVQDEATSVVWGMPGFVAGAGLASEVLPLAQLAPEVSRRVAARGGRAARTGRSA